MGRPIGTMHTARLPLLSIACLCSTALFAQPDPPRAQVMTLGVFHFNFPNQDVVQVAESDMIDVLTEPYAGEIADIAKALVAYRPTHVAVEALPDQQQRLDSLYNAYREERHVLGHNEIYQLGFRLAAMLGLDGVHAVDDFGRHYPHIEALFSDSAAMARFEQHYLHAADVRHRVHTDKGRITSIVDALVHSNDPAHIEERLSLYLLNPFSYEDEPHDFLGVDFETGRWFNRNLRIFRNLQRLPLAEGDRVLLIIGSEHLNLLNHFLSVSKEFEFVSPMPYLRKALGE